MDGDKNHMWKLAGHYSSVGIELFIGFCLPTLAGAWADKHFDTGPWLFMFGLAVGIGAATRTMMRIMRQFKRDKP